MNQLDIIKKKRQIHYFPETTKHWSNGTSTFWRRESILSKIGTSGTLVSRSLQHDLRCLDSKPFTNLYNIQA